MLVSPWGVGSKKESGIKVIAGYIDDRSSRDRAGRRCLRRPQNSDRKGNASRREGIQKMAEAAGRK